MSLRAPSDAVGAPADRNASPAKDDADAPTVPLTPRDRTSAPKPPRASRARRDATLVDGSVFEAMHVEEAERARGFGRALMILCIARLAVDPLITPTASWLRIAAAVALAGMGAVGGWVWWRARDPARYSRRVFRIFGCTAVAAGTVFLFHGGVFSPMPLLITLGISFFALGADTPFAFGIPIACAALYALLSSLVAFGVVPDMGLFRADHVPFATHAFPTAAPADTRAHPPGVREITAALEAAGGRREQAAAALGVSRMTLWKWMKRLDIQWAQAAPPEEGRK